jgi:hypothetical protein
MTTFAINIFGYISNDDYDQYKIREMLNRQAMTKYFPSFRVFDIAVKEIPEPGESGHERVDIKKGYKKRAKK